jgi:hypothetical protein
LFININILALDIPSIKGGLSRSVKQYTLHTAAKKDICVSFRCDAAIVCGLENVLKYFAFQGIITGKVEVLKFYVRLSIVIRSIDIYKFACHF